MIKLEKYADIKEQKDLDTEKTAQERFQKQIEKEELKYQNLLQKAKEKANKEQSQFDEKAFREQFIYNSKHIIAKEDYAEMLVERDTARKAKRREKEIEEIEKVNKKLQKIKVEIS